MTWGWQDVLTFAVVGAAAAYLARGAWRTLARRSAGGCGTGGCTGCPSNATTPGRPPGDGPGQVIPLDALTRHPPRR
jgi:hypothetical protein